jgi:uncharacterized cupin superfamily protein
METYNLFTGSTKASDPDDPPPYDGRFERLGPQLGAQLLGGTVYELGAGQAICPYHYEYGNEEWLIVVTGRPTLRTPESERVLEPGDVVCFREGPEGAHKVSNSFEEASRVLMLSTKRMPDVTFYPDSGKLGVWSGNADDRGIFRRGDAVDYFEGEALEE